MWVVQLNYAEREREIAPQLWCTVHSCVCKLCFQFFFPVTPLILLACFFLLGNQAVSLHIPSLLTHRLAGTAGPRDRQHPPGPPGAAGVWLQVRGQRDGEGEAGEEEERQPLLAGAADSPESVVHHPALLAQDPLSGQADAVRLFLPLALGQVRYWYEALSCLVSKIRLYRNDHYYYYYYNKTNKQKTVFLDNIPPWRCKTVASYRVCNYFFGKVWENGWFFCPDLKKLHFGQGL